MPFFNLRFLKRVQYKKTWFPAPLFLRCPSCRSAIERKTLVGKRSTNIDITHGSFYGGKVKDTLYKATPWYRCVSPTCGRIFFTRLLLKKDASSRKKIEFKKDKTA